MKLSIIFSNTIFIRNNKYSLLILIIIIHIITIDTAISTTISKFESSLSPHCLGVLIWALTESLEVHGARSTRRLWGVGGQEGICDAPTCLVGGQAGSTHMAEVAQGWEAACSSCVP